MHASRARTASSRCSCFLRNMYSDTTFVPVNGGHDVPHRGRVHANVSERGAAVEVAASRAPMCQMMVAGEFGSGHGQLVVWGKDTLFPVKVPQRPTAAAATSPAPSFGLLYWLSLTKNYLLCKCSAGSNKPFCISAMRARRRGRCSFGRFSARVSETVLSVFALDTDGLGLEAETVALRPRRSRLRSTPCGGERPSAMLAAGCCA